MYRMIKDTIKSKHGAIFWTVQKLGQHIVPRVSTKQIVPFFCCFKTPFQSRGNITTELPGRGIIVCYGQSSSNILSSQKAKDGCPRNVAGSRVVRHRAFCAARADWFLALLAKTSRRQRHGCCFEYNKGWLIGGGFRNSHAEPLRSSYPERNETDLLFRRDSIALLHSLHRMKESSQSCTNVASLKWQPQIVGESSSTQS